MSFMGWLLIGLILLLTGCAGLSRREQPSALLNKDWRSFDGKIMPFTHWGSGQPRAVVIAVHGLSGAASDFWLAGERLAERGIHLYAFEVRGQGHDPVKTDQGHIRSSRLWQRDLQSFTRLVQARHPDVQTFWLGESLGSLIALHTATSTKKVDQCPNGLILMSPVAGLREPLPGGKRWLLDAASVVLPRKRVRLGDLAGVDESQIQVTSTTTHGDQMAVTEHHVSSFSMRLLAATGRWMDEAGEAASRWRPPLLMLASPNDVVTAPDQVAALFHHFNSADKTLLWYKRSHHLLLHDVERDQVATDLVNWIEFRLSSLR